MNVERFTRQVRPRPGLATHRRSRLGGGLWMVPALVMLCAPAWAKPYKPKDDAQVLQTLPRVLFHARDKLRGLREQLKKNPRNSEAAAELASNYLQIGKRENDPRFYGYARAALAPWWGSTTAPVNILKVRAKFKGRNHEFEAALADHRLVLLKRPHDVQAWLNVANLCRVLGRYDQAREACRALSTFAGPTAVTLCRAPLQADTGEAIKGFNSLADLLKSVRGKKPGLVQYIITIQATIARALGRSRIAEARFTEGLTNKPDDQYLIRAYCDFLLDHGRNSEVISLAQGHHSDMGILLRAALAARNSGQTQLANKWKTQLANRFKEIHLRGSEPNGRYEARFTLGFTNDPDKALALALKNWKKQKELLDARNVLEASLAADRPTAAKPVIDFLHEHHTQHVILDELIQRVEQAKAQAKANTSATAQPKAGAKGPNEVTRENK